MNLRTIDLDTVRTLIIAHGLGGYGKAAVRLGRTPSAISLQMKRLQEDLGVEVFRKSGRRVELTEAGEIVLRVGRRMLALNDELLHTIQGASLAGTVRLGCSQDFAEVVLPQALSQFSKYYPLVQMEVRIEGNAALVEAIETEQLDVALVVGHADRPSAEVLGELDLVWIRGKQFSAPDREPLPLVLLGPQCAFRKQAIRSLDRAGIPWRIAAVSPSLAGIWASALGGLGVTARSALGLPAKLVSAAQMFDLPQLGSFPATLHMRQNDTSESSFRLRALIREAVARTLRP